MVEGLEVSKAAATEVVRAAEVERAQVVLGMAVEAMLVAVMADVAHHAGSSEHVVA